MKIKTPKGISGPMPLTDLQEFSKQQKIRNYISIAWIILVFLFLLYIKFNNILNNIVATCL